MKSRYLLTVGWVGILSVLSAFAAQRGESKDDKPSTSTNNSPRFADLVRADFFAGMQGDRARFERAMQLCETTMAKNPEDAEAMVWHGSGLLIRQGYEVGGAVPTRTRRNGPGSRAGSR
jgi:hypothetical protein